MSGPTARAGRVCACGSRQGDRADELQRERKVSAGAREELLIGASAVSIERRALLIEGPPGSGKSSLCLALIARGALLIGDDGVALSRRGERLVAAPPPRARGLLEVHGIGLASMAIAEPAPLALILSLPHAADRMPERAARRDMLGCTVPVLPFAPGDIAPAERALWALQIHGLP